LGDRLVFRTSDAPTEGFRAFTVSLVVSQPATVDALVGGALDAGATTLKPGKRCSGVTAASSKRRTGRSGRSRSSLEEERRSRDPADRRDRATARVGGRPRQQAVSTSSTGSRSPKSFGGKYVQFATGPVTLALYRHDALAKDRGVPPKAPARTELSSGRRRRLQ